VHLPNTNIGPNPNPNLTLGCTDMVDVINGTNYSRLYHSRSTGYVLGILPTTVVKNQSSWYPDSRTIP